MSIQLGKLCSVFLENHFGTTVRIVGDCLFSSISKTIPALKLATNLTLKQIIRALQILLKFNLVKYKAVPSNENIAEFSLIPSNILLVLRYPRFMHLVRTKVSHIAASLLGELLKEGSERASSIIVKAATNAEKTTSEYLQELREEFTKLVRGKFLIRAPVPLNEGSTVPVLVLEASKNFILPEISVQTLLDLVAGKHAVPEDADVYWQVNAERMHQELRDNLLVSAIDKRIDGNAGECMRHMLDCCYAITDPWKAVSAPLSMGEIRRTCEKKSSNESLTSFVEDYVAMIDSDTMEFTSKIGEIDGGQYTINFRKCYLELAWNCVEQSVAQKFGVKAARIFRVVRLKKFIEQENIQREAMIPAKEAKLLTYKLIEENFLQMHPVRKAGGGGAGPAKAFYLLHVKLPMVVMILVDNCYKGLRNSLVRSADVMEGNKRLIDKSQYYEGVIEDLREKGGEEAEQQIADLMEQITPPEREILQKVKLRLKTLSAAEIALDETLFLLQMYQFYNNLP